MPAFSDRIEVPPITAPPVVHFALLATMVAWGLNVSAVRWLTGVMPVLQVAALRMVCAVLVLVALLAAGGLRLPRLRGRSLLLACGSALLMVYANQLVFASAMQRTAASNAALILALNPLLIGLLEAGVFRKRLSASYLVGGFTAVAGVSVVVLNRPGASLAGPGTGDLLVLASMLCFSFGILGLQRLARDHPPLGLNTFMYLLATAALVLHAVVVLPDPSAVLFALDWRGWAVLLFSGVVATALGAVAWGRGIAILGVGRAAVYMSWVPVLGVAFGALLLGEPLTAWHALGVVLVLAGTLTSTLGLPRVARAFGA